MSKDLLTPRNSHHSSIDAQEVEKFSNLANEWWNEQGKFRPLHIFNPIRIKYIRDKIIEHFSITKPDMPLSGYDLLDIGSGGGLVSEPMHRLGANITGIDASEKNIKAASTHAHLMNLNINYLNLTAEELAAQGKQFDIILNLEVIEHVANVEYFVSSCAELLKPGGIMFIATLNRTVKSYILAIIGAEYILRWLPKGTHDWSKFLTPADIHKHLTQNNLVLKELQGMSYNIISNSWSLSGDLNVNYFAVVIK